MKNILCKPYNANIIANYFLDQANKLGEFISPMKLQKLIYFAHGWSLAINKSPLINENIEAWQYGPVIPSVYHEFKDFRGNAIDRYAQTDIYEEEELQCDNLIRALLDRVWSVYRGFSAFELSEMTHLPNSPWSQAKSQSNKTNVTISDEIIQNYFTTQLKENLGKNDRCS